MTNKLRLQIAAVAKNLYRSHQLQHFQASPPPPERPRSRDGHLDVVPRRDQASPDHDDEDDGHEGGQRRRRDAQQLDVQHAGDGSILLINPHSYGNDARKSSILKSRGGTSLELKGLGKNPACSK